MLTVPKAQEPYINLLAGLPARDREALQSALEDSGPQLYVPDLAHQVAEHGPLDLPSMMGVLTVVGSLLATHRSLGERVELTADLVVDAARSGELLDSEEQAENLRAAMEMLLTSEPIHTTLKAGELALEADQIFAEARIFTDFRPVFSDDDHVSAGVILHTLRISLVGGDRISVVLDDSDLKKLESQIARARNKSTILRERFEDSDIRCLLPRDMS